MLKKLIATQLRQLADKIDAGNTNLTEEESMEILGVLIHEALSLEQACSYLNLRRSRFNELIRLGKLPKGRKVKGRTGLTWYKDELSQAKKLLKK